MTHRTEIPVTDFTFDGTGNYRSKPDRRDLFQIIHPWTTSKAGDFGRMSLQVSVPAAAQPPFTLVFYVMDNNYTGPEDTEVRWINRDLRVGHRFREAMVDGEVVWREDTCLDDKSTHQIVDVSNHVTPGKAFTLAFQLRDAVDSDVTMPGDVHITAYYATEIALAVDEVVTDYHETKSYWGDVAIYTGSCPERDDFSSGWETQLKTPPPKPYSVPPATRELITLDLELAELTTGPWAWPVRQGLPFAMGAIANPSHIAITRPGGVILPATVEPLNTWQDGSVQWALASFTLRPGTCGPCNVSWGSDVQPDDISPANPVAATDDLEADNGLIRVACDVNRPNAALSLGVSGADCIVDSLSAYLASGDTTFDAQWLTGRVVTRTAQFAMLQLEGELSAEDGERYGSCRLRVSVFADCPHIRLEFTISSERPEATYSASQYGLKLGIDSAEPLDTEVNWAVVQTPAACLTVVARWFEKLWPNAIEMGTDGVELVLFAAGDDRLPSYDTHPGEARTHEIWLAVTDEAPDAVDCTKLAALVDTPPRLDISARIRESRVWGDLPQLTPTCHADVYAKVEERLAPYFSACKENIRLFGEYPTWDNFYWNTLHTMYCMYAMTGERKWWDWAERSVRHLFDVDICHWLPNDEAPGDVGAVHGYWGDHSDMPTFNILQHCDGAFDHWNLTGDPDGYDYGVDIAEFSFTNTDILVAESTRDQGWPIIALLCAWRQTGDEKYGPVVRSYVESALDKEEPRRGTYIEVHGSVTYLGPTPFMYGILCTALREYHLRTGDERAATLVARLAVAMYEEAHDPWESNTLPNLDYHYSPNPYLRYEDGHTPITHLNLNIAAAQAYGAYVTQDAELADIARRTWIAGLDGPTIAGRDGGTIEAEMAYDLAGVVWWLDRLDDQDATGSA